MTLWLIVSSIALLILFVLRRNQSLPALCVMSSTLIVAPLASMLLFPSTEFDWTVTALSVFGLCLLAPQLLSASDHAWAETTIVESRRMWTVLIGGAILVVLGNVFVYRTLLSSYSIVNLYQMNVAWSDDTVPHFGIWGRLSRLAIPLGMLAFAIATLAPVRLGTRRRLYTLSAFFAISTIGVRRSTFLYVCAFYFIIWLTTIRDARRFVRVAAGGAVAYLSLLWFFGYIQIATHKSAYTSPWQSGLHEGLLYFAGNLPYAECAVNGGVKPTPGFSFPFVTQLIGRLSGNDVHLTKPFCMLATGQLFNTSPAYTDVAVDFGLLGVAVFGALLGALVAAAGSRLQRSAGVHAVILATILFAVRENILGQLDVIQALVLYPIALSYLTHAHTGPRSSPMRLVGRL